jgi:phosphatidate cytidylyltransferase
MMHLYRWLTGIIAVPLLVYIVSFGSPWLFRGLIFVASVVGLLEFIRLTAPGFPFTAKVLAVLLDLLFVYCLSGGPFFQILAILCLWVMIPLGFYLFSSQTRRNSAADEIGKAALGFLYVSLPLALLLIMVRHPKGHLWILFLFTVIFAGDTGAFYFGRWLGKHRLYPAVSPGKTWEGSVGGLLAGVASGLIFSSLFRLGEFPLDAGLLAGSLSVCGQIGDLVESMIKRGAGVKDSGRILPGHGGMLDRVDSVLFAIPVLYLFLTWAAS